jgi:hypothetical protein
MILGGTIVNQYKNNNPFACILFPRVLQSLDLLISARETPSIRSTHDLSMNSPMEDPITILQKGYFVTIFLADYTIVVSTHYLLRTNQSPTATWACRNHNSIYFYLDHSILYRIQV